MNNGIMFGNPTFFLDHLEGCSKSDDLLKQHKWTDKIYINRDTEPIIIILVLPPGVVCQSNCALPMPGTADGDVVSRCQVLGREGSVHHGADQLGVAWSA